MTFEEFFIKKKIDLHQLQLAEPSLYKEFKSHFALMGEKSFDHTKKYWFNRLRKNFHLAEEGTQTTPATAVPLANQQQEIPSSDPSTINKPTGFRPRFKAVTPQASDKTSAENPTTTKPEEAAGQKPMGFKPRFKPGKADSDSVKATKNDKEQQEPTIKPTGFKPRFKAGMTNKAAVEGQDNTSPSDSEASASDITKEESNAVSATPSPSKPIGFKPRFKPGVTDKTINSEEKTTQETSNEQDSTSPPANTSKPLGFKPRFKPGVTDKTINSEEKTTQETSNEQDSTSPPANTPKPLGFKPRFKPGVTNTANTLNKTEIKEEEPLSEKADDESVKPNESKPDKPGASADNTPKPLGFKPRFKPKNKSNEGEGNA
ncbi:hypothetical protein GCM10023231_36490 [Olivibacter ginsenosidimutans]|uniref:Uncharacterized protein n=1 Tax=Olivibacter ginsenosidimutans TaxID=1176537 RepID=A0ABP9C336_9SPHI